MPSVNTKSPLAQAVRRNITRALNDYSMIRPDDRIIAAVSGGKDSTVMAFLLQEIRRRAPFQFSFEAILIDQGQPGFDPSGFRDFLKKNGMMLTVIRDDTWTVSKEKVKPGESVCPLCARFRRGILYSYAEKNGFNKIALGHHSDDLIETLLINIFYEGRTASMPPKLLSDDRKNTVIRPMIYIAESDLSELSREWEIPVIDCGSCRESQGEIRSKMKTLICELEKTRPDVRSSLLKSLSNIRISQMMDRSLWDFESL